jgi:hypothetical protein
VPLVVVSTHAVYDHCSGAVFSAVAAGGEYVVVLNAILKDQQVPLDLSSWIATHPTLRCPADQGRNLLRGLVPRGMGDDSCASLRCGTATNSYFPGTAGAQATPETQRDATKAVPILPDGPERSDGPSSACRRRAVTTELVWLEYPPRQRQVLATLSAVLSGTLASVNDDN